MEEVGQGVWAPAESGGEACHSPFPHHQTHGPFPPPQPFYEIRQCGRWKTAGPFPLGFQPEVIFHSFNWLL